MKIYNINNETNCPIWINCDYIIDPFSKEKKLIHNNWIYRYFRKTYKLTYMNIWNMLNGYSLETIHYCVNPVCSNTTEIDHRHLNHYRINRTWNI